MKIYEVKDEDGEVEYGVYRVTSPWFPDRAVTINLGITDLHNSFKDEFVWAVFDKLQATEKKLVDLEHEFNHLQKHHIKRALFVTELANKIRDLEQQIENNGNSGHSG